MTPINLQKMIEISQNYVRKWLLQISHSKRFVMVMSASKRNAPQHFTWKIYSQPSEVVTARHVGILMSSNLKPDIAITDACQRGRAAFHSTFGFAFKTQISINPSSSLKLYRSVVQPAFLYGCESMSRKENPQKLTQFKISSKPPCGKKDSTKRHHHRHDKRQPGE